MGCDYSGVERSKECMGISLVGELSETFGRAGITENRGIEGSLEIWKYVSECIRVVIQ